MSKLSALRPPLHSILVVDDEPDIVESLKSVFEANLDSVEVYTALSGAAAIQVLEREKVDLVISDYKMPGMDGLEFLIQARMKAPQAPRILLTAYPELNVAVRAINEAQIQNFLTKPVSPDALMEVVNAALLKSRSRERRTAEFAARVQAGKAA